MQETRDSDPLAQALGNIRGVQRFYWFRFFGSAVVATVFVLVVVVIGVDYYEPELEDPVSATMRSVNLVDAQDPELKQALAESGLEVPTRRRPEPPKPLLEERQVSGFVQLLYTVNPDGSTSNVRVIGAVPRGYYEEQAVAEIERRMHSPGYENGEPVARELEAVIEFTVPASSRRVDTDDD